MKDGFIRCAAATVDIHLADTTVTTRNIIENIKKADKLGIDLLVFPELCITGSTCADLFLSEALLNSARKSLEEIASKTIDTTLIVVVGLPLSFSGKLYNCAAVINSGEILGIIPKTIINNTIFSSAETLPNIYNVVSIGEDIIPFSSKLIFKSAVFENFAFGVSVGEDLLSNISPLSSLCSAGATLILNPAAFPHTAGSTDLIKNTIISTTVKNLCGCVFASCANGESTQDALFAPHLIVAENGTIKSEILPFADNNFAVSEIDINLLSNLRLKSKTFIAERAEDYTDTFFSHPIRNTEITFLVDKNPFLQSLGYNDTSAEEILNIQANGLKRRMACSGADTAVIGVSGGLDSTLALLVAARTMDISQKSRKDIIAVTLPCFGTTNRTRSNAEIICEALGVTFKEINIKNSVLAHFTDIGHDSENHNTTYENAQSRERTQVLMDIANMHNGLVVGTGDLSELALGWATYNGDHMSMYGVNASLTKTAIQRMIADIAESAGPSLRNVLIEILQTPVSPELLPADKNGNITQKTEDFVGPYELHDFFIYYTLSYGFSPTKIYRLAKIAFSDCYCEQTILKWLEIFFRRFFSQQFKRSCMPDGVKVGTLSLSPHSDWSMPSDATSSLWINEIEKLK